MASPMLDALKKAYPSASVAWLAEPFAKDLLLCHPALDHFLIWPKQEWKALLRQGRLVQFIKTVYRFKDQLNAYRFDLAIDAQGLFRSRALAYISGAPQRLGLESKEPGRFLMTRVISRGTDRLKLSSEYAHLMRSLGIDVNGFFPRIYVSKGDRQEAHRLLRPLENDSAPVVLCPFTTREQKHWLDDRWAELIAFIHSSLGRPVVMLGSQNDHRRSQRIAAQCSGQVLQLAGHTSLGQAAAVIEKAAAVIGVDTGLTHMGLALKRPTVALFGATCPYLETGMDTVRIVYHPLTCSPCRRKPTCKGRFDCMKLITVEQVAKTVVDLLDRSETKT